MINDLVENVDYSEAADFVGITANTAQVPRAYQIADEFRSRGVKVVIGGVHATFMEEEARLHADSVVLGEAEDLWEGILEDAERGNLQPHYKSKSPACLDRLAGYWNAYRRVYSIPSILSSSIRNAGFSRHKLQEFMRSLSFKWGYRSKIRNLEHPISGGMFRLPTRQQAT